MTMRCTLRVTGWAGSRGVGWVSCASAGRMLKSSSTAGPALALVSDNAPLFVPSTMRTRHWIQSRLLTTKYGLVELRVARQYLDSQRRSIMAPSGGVSQLATEREGRRTQTRRGG